MNLDSQAVELNNSITAANPAVLAMLSDKGKKIFFPKKGILSQSAEAAGKEINATIGTALEDDGSPMALDALFKQFNVKSKAMFNYAPSPGRPEIRSTWKEMLFKKNPGLTGKTISSPVVTSALTHGLSMAGYLFLDEGDSIILPDLYWENYNLIFSHAFGAKIDTYPTFSGDGYNIDGFEKKLNEGPVGKKVVLLNFPNNPTGYTVTETEAQKICTILVKAADAGNSLVVLIDDAYFGLVYEKGILAESLFSTLADAHERILAVKFDGPTKEDYVWGFRVGFVTFGCKTSSPAFYTALEGKLAGAIRGNISNASNVGQTLLTTAYADAGYDAEKQEKFDILCRRYRKMRDIFASKTEYADFFTPLPFNSGYFMCVKVQSGNAEVVREVLLKKYSTGIIAQGDVIRIAFSAVPIEKLEKLLGNIYLACKDV